MALYHQSAAANGGISGHRGGENGVSMHGMAA